MGFIFVGLGGAIGAILRYSIGLIPINMSFPLKTLLINILGSFLIGLFAGFFSSFNVSKNLRLLLETGLCGGFTTFSTFSLENINLLENKQYGEAILYMGLSLGCSLLGAYLGKSVVKLFI